MLTLWPLLLLLGCSVAHRSQKALLPNSWVTPDEPIGEQADVRYHDGRRRSEETPYDPPRHAIGGRALREVVPLTNKAWVQVEPKDEPVALRVLVRNASVSHSEFFEVTSLTGSLDGTLANEIRFLPRRLDTAYRLHLHQLVNPYNDYSVRHGDLVLIEVQADGHEAERYLFRNRQLGLRAKLSGGVLFTFRLPFLPINQPETVFPVFAGTLAFGYRYPTRSDVGRWFGDHFSVVATVGIGSTALQEVTGQDGVEAQVVGAFNAVLIGGGVEFYDMVSLQALGNFSSLTRDFAEAPFTFAIGFDAVTFADHTRNLVSKIVRANRIDREE